MWLLGGLAVLWAIFVAPRAREAIFHTRRKRINEASPLAHAPTHVLAYYFYTHGKF